MASKTAPSPSRGGCVRAPTHVLGVHWEKKTSNNQGKVSPFGGNRLSVRSKEADTIFLLNEDLGELETRKIIQFLGFIQSDFPETPVRAIKP